MATTIFGAIADHWDAEDLDTTITGGLHLDQADDGRAGQYPYAAMMDLGNSPNLRTNAKRYRRQAVQIEVFHTSKALVETATQAVVAAFTDDAGLVLTMDDHTILEVNVLTVRYFEDARQKHRAVIELMFDISKDRA